MLLNLVSDPGGRAMARAISRAYQMGYDDAKTLHRDGRKIYSRKSGKKIAKEIASLYRKEHCKFLRQAYGAGMWQYRQAVGPIRTGGR